MPKSHPSSKYEKWCKLDMNKGNQELYTLSIRTMECRQAATYNDLRDIFMQDLFVIYIQKFSV